MTLDLVGGQKRPPVQRPARVAVIGGGFAGMAAAQRLAGLDVEVILLEQRRRLGGRVYSRPDRVTGEPFDNGQHVVTGAYSATLRFLRALGTDGLLTFQPQLRLDLLDTHASPAALQCPPLPAPLHLLAALLRLPGLSLRDRLAGLRLGPALRGSGRPAAAAGLDALTVEEWLLRAGQTPRLRRMLWDPLTLAIVNETPDRASALPLVRALAESFLGARGRSRMGIPAGELSRLFEPELARHLEARGGQVRTSTRAAALELAQREGQETVVGVTTADGDRIEVDGVIAAVPHHDLPELLPEAWQGRAPFAGLPGLGTSPILSVHLWLDREVTELPFAGLLGTRSQWVFNRRRLAGDVQGHALSVIISAARAEMGAHREALVERTMEDLRRLLPRSRDARLISSRVIKERRATFSARPGTNALRPGPRTPIRSLCLAGDWTDTGLPATIEGAARSGFRAAECVLLSCRS